MKKEETGLQYLSEKVERLREENIELREENAELKRQLIRHGKLVIDDDGEALPIDKIFSGDL